MKDIVFLMPRSIEVGFYKSTNIISTLGKSFNNLLVVIDYNVNKLGIANDILNNLKENNIEFTIFDEIKNEPTISEIDRAIKQLNVATKFDGVIGIGGGSTMDLAKLLAVSKRIKGSVKDYVNKKEIEDSGIPMVMIPTTSGTGSEATPNAIVKDEKAKCKMGVVSKYLIPDLVILDPGLTLTLPPKITAETGMDAFTHAIECFICNKANEMSNLYALNSIRLIANNIRQAVKDGKNKEARYKMALGSLYGGIAITNSGTGGVHALAYPLGGKYGISHGLSNSILLPEVMKYNAEVIPEKFVKVAEVMGLDTANLSQEKIIEVTITEIKSLVEDTGISLKELEISENILDDLAKSAMSVQRLLENNPRHIDYDDARLIYKNALWN